MSLASLACLDAATLRSLARLLAGYGDVLPPAHRIDQALSSDTRAVQEGLAALIDQGWKPFQLAQAIDALATAKFGITPVPGMEYVLSGPAIRNVPTRDTAAVVQSLLADADEDVLIVGYAFYNGKDIFRVLSDRWRSRPEMRVRFIVDIKRGVGDSSLDDQIVSRYLSKFWKQQWPYAPTPEILYDARALRVDAATRAAVHAKCIIVDRRIALVTSANFTPAAQERNIEVGVLLRDEGRVRQLADFFGGLIEASLTSAQP